MSPAMHRKLHASAFDEQKAGETSGSAYLSNQCSVISVNLLIKAFGPEASCVLTANQVQGVYFSVYNPASGLNNPTAHMVWHFQKPSDPTKPCLPSLKPLPESITLSLGPSAVNVSLLTSFCVHIISLLNLTARKPLFLSFLSGTRLDILSSSIMFRQCDLQVAKGGS